MIYTSSIIKELRKRCSAKKNLCYKLTLLGEQYDHRNCSWAFERIAYFSILRRKNIFVERNNGTQNLCQIILKLYLKKLRTNLTKLKLWFDF